MAPNPSGRRGLDFKNRAALKLNQVSVYMRYLTGESDPEPLDVSAFATEARDITDIELDRLREIEADGGVASCYADAAAAYSEVIFSWNTSACHALRYPTDRLRERSGIGGRDVTITRRIIVCASARHVATFDRSGR